MVLLTAVLKNKKQIYVIIIHTEQMENLLKSFSELFPENNLKHIYCYIVIMNFDKALNYFVAAYFTSHI